MGKKMHVVADAVTSTGRKAKLMESCDCEAPSDDKSDEGGEREVMMAVPVRSGEPVPMGASVGVFNRIDDDHMEFEEVGTVGAERSGPAQVATKSYRDGWERIFGGGASSGEVN